MHFSLCANMKWKAIMKKKTQKIPTTWKAVKIKLGIGCMWSWFRRLGGTKSRNVPQIHGNTTNNIWRQERVSLCLNVWNVWNVIQRLGTSIRDFPLKEGFPTFPFYWNIQIRCFQSKDKLEDDSDEKCASGECEMLSKKNKSHSGVCSQPRSPQTTLQEDQAFVARNSCYRESFASLPTTDPPNIPFWKIRSAIQNKS